MIKRICFLLLFALPWFTSYCQTIRDNDTAAVDALIAEVKIAAATDSAKAVGLDNDLADYATDFLLDRRTKLIPLIMANRAQFPSLAPDLFDGLERGN